MHALPLSPDFAVAAQITPADLPAIASQGFRSVICNRPDGEEAGQPGFALIEKAAQAAGVQAVYLPIVPGRMTQADVDQLESLLQTLPKPVLAYCRSGSRSGVLWQQCQP